MLFIETGQDRIPPGVQQQVATVQNQGSTNALMSVWYDPSQINDATPRFKLGSVWQDDATGNYFQYLKAGAALAIGQVVTAPAPGTDTVSSVGANFDTVTLVTGGLTAGAESGNYAYFNSGTQGGTPYNQQLRLIKQNTANVLTVSQKGSIFGNNQYDPDQLSQSSVALAGGSNVSIIRPYQVIVGTATSIPVGVALGTVTSGNYTIIQITGLAFVLGINTNAGLTVNTPAIPAASGQISGIANQVTATPLQNLYNAAASIIPQYTISSGTASLVPCYINFRGM